MKHDEHLSICAKGPFGRRLDVRVHRCNGHCIAHVCNVPYGRGGRRKLGKSLEGKSKQKPRALRVAGAFEITVSAGCLFYGTFSPYGLTSPCLCLDAFVLRRGFRDAGLRDALRCSHKFLPAETCEQIYMATAQRGMFRYYPRVGHQRRRADKALA